MKSTMLVKAAAIAVVVALAGCTDLKPLQAQVDDLKSQVSKLQSEVQGANSAAAQAAQAAVDATNEKIDRMFKRSISK